MLGGISKANGAWRVTANPYMNIGPTFGQGASNNGHWQTGSQIHSSSTVSANQPNAGASAQGITLAQYHAQLSAQQLAIYNNTYPVEPPEPIERAGIAAGEIVGWRSWYVRGGFLTSVYMDSVWSPDEPMHARQKVGDYDQSGIHAWKRQTEAFGTYINVNGNNMPGIGIVGRVQLWGEVVEHEQGYRAEYGKALSLDYIFCRGNRRSKDRQLKELRERYKIAA